MSSRKVTTIKREYDPATDQVPMSLTEAKARIKYLGGELQMLNSRVSAQEETLKGFDVMKADVDQIALYFRSNMASEIDAGKHAGRSLGEVVTGYFSELSQVRDMLLSIPRWIRSIFGVDLSKTSF